MNVAVSSGVSERRFPSSPDCSSIADGRFEDIAGLGRLSPVKGRLVVASGASPWYARQTPRPLFALSRAPGGDWTSRNRNASVAPAGALGRKEEEKGTGRALHPRACGLVAQFANRAAQPSRVPRAACPPVLRATPEEHWRASRQWHTAVADPMSIGQQALAPEATTSRPLSGLCNADTVSSNPIACPRDTRCGVRACRV